MNRESIFPENLTVGGGESRPDREALQLLPRLGSPSTDTNNRQVCPMNPTWSILRRRRSIATAASISVFCIFVMVFTSITPFVAAAGSGSSGGAGTFATASNGTRESDYPFAVPPADYPVPSSLPLVGNVTHVATAIVPGAPSTYAVAYTTHTTSNAGPSGGLWFAEASYSAADAKEIAKGGNCGPGCGELPIQWSNLDLVTTFDRPVLNVGIGMVGSSPLVVASVGEQTYVYNWSASVDGWIEFCSPIEGTFQSIATDPESAGLVTLTENEAEVTTISADGSLLGSALVGSGGSGTVMGASIAITPAGSSYLESLAFTVQRSNQLLFSTSRNGNLFTPPSFVANFSTNYSESSIGSMSPGQTIGPVAQAGQIDLVGAGSQLFLMFTTNASGQTVPVTESSANDGRSWQGPYFDGPINGTTLDPDITVGPTGLIYSTWEDPDYGAGAVDVAIYFPDGYPLIAPETVPSSDTAGVSPLGPPVISVDGFGRPLLFWPSASNTSGLIAYTGSFLSPVANLEFLTNESTTTVTSPDFTGDDHFSSRMASFTDNVTRLAQSAESNLSRGDVCNAQNLTAMGLYSNLTHFPLSEQHGSGTVCATTFRPNEQVSPMVQSVGVGDPNTYLAVYADWALEAEGVPISVSPLSGLSDFSPYSEATPSAVLPTAVTRSETVSSDTASVTVLPTPYSPTSYELSVSDSLPTWRSSTSAKCFLSNGGWGILGVSRVTSVTATWTNISINNGTVHSLVGTTGFSSVWLYDLPADQSFYWTATFSARTTEVATTTDACTHSTSTQDVVPVTLGSSSVPTLSLSGTFSTTLSISYGTTTSNFLTASFNAEGTDAHISTAFGTSLPATISGSLTNSSRTQDWNATTFATTDSYAFPKASAVNTQYDLRLSSESRVGSNTAGGSPAIQYDAQGDAPAESVWADCRFTLTTSTLPTIGTWSGGPFWDNGSTTIAASWTSNVNAPGFLIYHEIGSSINVTISEIAGVPSGSGNWNYTVELHGLEPSERYDGEFGVSVIQGCLTDQDGVETQTFQASSDPATPLAVPSMWVQGLTYNSITHVGGGIRLYWNNPTTAKKGVVNSGAATIASKTGAAEKWILPFDKAQITQTANGTTLTNSVELAPPLVQNIQYIATVELNYSTIAHAIVSSNQAQFTYLYAPSGNGLTWNEQETGWNITLQPCSAVALMGTACGSHVHAVPGNFSTNGLASDFVEKELDLNPNLVDTAGSHMLDLWNLTFDLLGSNGKQQAIPTGIHAWWEENGSKPFDPFGTKTYPNGPNLSGTPVATGLTDLLCTETSCVGDTPWSSEALFANSQLQVFSKLPGVAHLIKSGGWVRAIVGVWDGIPTLTIWGKLSWGANPRAQSSVSNGVSKSVVNNDLPDGSRVSPVYVKDLKLDFDAATVCVASATSAFDWAIEFYVNATTKSGPLVEFNGYSEQESDSGSTGCESLFYDVSLPVNDTYRTQTVTAFAVEAVTLNGHTVIQPIYTKGLCQGLFDTYDLLSGGISYVSTKTDCPAYYPPGSVYSQIWFNASSEVVGKKDPTYLLDPTHNGTIQQIPGGEMEYIGESAFDLVVVNVTKTTAVTSDPVPNPWAGPPQSITFGPGLTNILIPRGVFLNSTLGYSLLRDKKMPQADSQLWAPAPLMGTTEDEAMQGLLGSIASTSLGLLSCYWQDRALPSLNGNPEQGTLCPVPFENGVSASNSNLVEVYGDGSEAETANSGGLPGDPALEDSSRAGGALQAVITVNISDSYNDYGQDLGATPSLDLLLAGLLDNYTDGVNGTLVNVTSDLAVLGLPTTVLSALPNSTWVSSGVYGPPQLVTTSHVSCSWLGCLYETISNAADSFWNWIVKGVTYFASFGWIGAIESFFDALPSTLKAILVILISPFLGAYYVLTHLSQIGGEIWNEFLSVMTWVGTQVVDKILGPLFAPFAKGATAYMNALATDLGVIVKDNAAGTSPNTEVSKMWGQMSGSVFIVALILATGVTLVLTILGGLSLGMTFLIPLLIVLALKGIDAAGDSIAKGSGSNPISDFEGISPETPGIGCEFEILEIGSAPYGPCQSFTSQGEVPAGGSQNPTTSALAADYGGIATFYSLVSTSIVGSIIATAIETDTPVYLDDVVSATLGIVSIIVAAAAKAASSLLGAVVSVATDAASIIVDLWPTPTAEPRNALVDQITLGLDIGAGLLDLAALGLTIWDP
jgi:hypothetical protein